MVIIGHFYFSSLAMVDLVFDLDSFQLIRLHNPSGHKIYNLNGKYPLEKGIEGGEKTNNLGAEQRSPRGLLQRPLK